MASAYTLSGCQERLDQMAGEHVRLIEHTDQVGTSIASLGQFPAYICKGSTDGVSQ